MKKPLNITFDTNIFDENNFDLSENSTLSQLIKYVQQGDITVFLSYWRNEATLQRLCKTHYY